MMTGGPEPVTEAELHAWLDGELPPERLAAVEAYLESHPEEKARLASYRAHRAMIARVFGVPVSSSPERRHGAEVGGWRRAGQGLAAGIVLFAAGTGAGWVARGFLEGPGAAIEAEAGAAAGFVADAVAAHRVYAVEVRHPVEVRADEREHLVAWLSKRLASPLKAPDLGGQGFALVGGRLLPGQGDQPAAQFMYENAEGRRITLYVRPSRSGDTSFRLVENRGLAALFWRDAGLAWALSGEVARETLEDLAHAVYAQINS